MLDSKKAADFDWQQPLMPYVKEVLAHHLIHEASADDDMKRNTDLIIHESRVSVRLRRFEDLHKRNFANEFTIRAERPSGADTELSKIVAGWGTYTFYGFANENYTGLSAWMLGDLNVFRRWFGGRIVKDHGKIPGDLISNPDGSSQFRAFTISDLPTGFVIARLTYDMSWIAESVERTSQLVETTSLPNGGLWTLQEQREWESVT